MFSGATKKFQIILDTVDGSSSSFNLVSISFLFKHRTDYIGSENKTYHLIYAFHIIWLKLIRAIHSKLRQILIFIQSLGFSLNLFGFFSCEAAALYSIIWLKLTHSLTHGPLTILTNYLDLQVPFLRKFWFHKHCEGWISIWVLIFSKNTEIESLKALYFFLKIGSLGKG